MPVNPEVVLVIQRLLNDGAYSEAVDNINIVCTQPGTRLPDVIVPQLFPSLLNATPDYTERCCKALDKLLQNTPVEVVICQMEVQLKQGFEHESPLVRRLCLKQLNRAVSDRRNLKMVGEVGIMKHAINLLADEDQVIVKECNKILLALAQYDEGIVILYSDQGVKLLKEVMVKSDIVRYRVFDVIIDSILISDQALECANNTGFTSLIIEDIESPDILLQLTALENVSRLADSPTAYTILKNLGIFKGVSAWLCSTQSLSTASYAVPSVIKLFAKLAQKHNVDLKQLCEECPAYLDSVFRLLNSTTSDLSIKFACVDVITLLNNRVDGKQVFLAHSSSHPAVATLSHLATRGTDDIKDRALVALAHCFSPPEMYIPEFEAVSERWFKGCAPALVKDVLQYLSHPSPGRQCAASSLLSNLVLHRYGIDSLTQTPGWLERLLDRSYCVEKESQSQKYALIMSIKRSPVVAELAGRDIINKLTKYLNEGAHYKPALSPSAVLEL